MRIPPLMLSVALASAATFHAGCSEVGTLDPSELDSTHQALSSGSTTIPSTGQSFEIELTSPTDGAIVPVGSFTVTGNVSIGGIAGAPVNVISVADLSGSTITPSNMDCNGDGVANAEDDLNHDGVRGDVLDCEISGIIALNQSLFGTVSVDVGLVGFGQTAAIADMQSASGEQFFTAPPEVDLSGNGTADHEDVARSLRRGIIGLFTPRSVGQATHFDAALTAVNAAFATQPAGENSLVFFLSDGEPQPDYYTGMSGPLAAAVAAGTQINTFAVGTNTRGCNPGTPLQEIADATGGTCTEVADPTALGAALPGMTPSGLDRVEVNGVAVPVDLLGNFSIDLACTSDEDVHVVAIGYADDVDATEVLADITVQCCTDSDGDGTCDGDDVCPADPLNDVDGDGACGDVDNCPTTANGDQADGDGDGAGDACDVCPLDPNDDADGDGYCADVDNCPATANGDQADGDGDGVGDACDVCPNDAGNDADGDGYCADVDNCPATANGDQADGDGDGDGDACDVCPLDAGNDADGDGLCADVDLCPDTEIPESVPTDKLGVNRFALVDGDGVFDTVAPEGVGPARRYTIADTGGCSCAQIIAAQGLGAGHARFGCSISAMDDWVATVP